MSTSVVRAFDILDHVAAAGSEGITLAKLSGGVPKARSTTHRYVATLLHLGVLRRDNYARLHLGFRLLELANELLEEDNLPFVAAPTLRDLGARTGEAVHLGVPTDGHIVYVAKVESSHTVRLVSRIGAQVALHCTSMGKAVLAQLPPTDLEAALSLPRLARTPHTLTDREDLIAELEKIRASGVSMDEEENELGVCCVGAAILDSRFVPVAAISVSGPSGRMTPERRAEITPLVRAATQRLEQALGYRRGDPALIADVPGSAASDLQIGSSG